MSRRFVWAMLAFAAGAAAMIFPAAWVLIGILAVLCLVIIPCTPMTLLVMLLVLSPLRALIATESDMVFALDIGQVLLFAYLFVWLGYQIVQRQPAAKVRSDIVLAATVALIILFAQGAWTGSSTSAWLREWLKWVIIAVFVWHLGLSASTHWRWLIFALLLGAAANAIVGLYIFLGGSGAEHLLILGRFFRAFGTFGQPNPFGGLMGMALPVSLMGAYGQLAMLYSRRRHSGELSKSLILSLALFSIVSLLIFCALIASWSRGAWLGFMLAAAVMLFAIPRRLSHSIALALGFILLAASLWLAGLLPQSIVSRLTTAGGDFFTIRDIRGVDISPVNYAVVERLAHWQAAVNMAEDKPILGVGLGNYEAVYNHYRLINWRQPLGHAHNYYLNILAETGIPGFFAYVAFWLMIWGLTWQIRNHPDIFARSIAIGLLGCWTYIAVHSLFDNLYVNNLFLHIGVLLGILAILYRQVNQSLNLES